MGASESTSEVPEENSNDKSGTSTGNSTDPIVSDSNVAHNEYFSNDRRAIIIEDNNDIHIKEYIIAVESLVNANDIKWSSKVPKNIILYLSDEKLVESITKARNKINIKGHNMLIKPLALEIMRITLYNVWPAIPDEVIWKKLSSIEIIPVSSIIRIPTAMSEPDYAHIYSLDRQVFIRSSDIKKLPDNIQIDYDNIKHEINIRPDSSTYIMAYKNGLQERVVIQRIVPIQPADKNTSIVNDSNVVLRNEDIKQTLSINSSSEASSSENPISNLLNSDKESNPSGIESLNKPLNMETEKAELKYSKKNSDWFKEILSPIKDVLEIKYNPYALDLDQFEAFLMATENQQKIMLPIAFKYSKDCDIMITMLHDINEDITKRQKIENEIINKIKQTLKTLEDHKRTSSSKAKTDQDMKQEGQSISEENKKNSSEE